MRARFQFGYLDPVSHLQRTARGNHRLYQRIEDFSLHILAAILVANFLTAVAMWYEIYYVVVDSTTETVKAILVDTAAAAAIGIFAVGTVDTYMVLSKLILEKYLENRFNDGKARGAEQNDEMWRAWYARMMEARERGEEFNEPPPKSPTRKS